jgi:hypothetical protein
MSVHSADLYTVEFYVHYMNIELLRDVKSKRNI